MFGVTDVATYIIGTILVIILPGPNSLYCLSVSASYGVKSGYKAIAGIVTGDSILILLTVLGAGTMLRVYPVLFNAMKLLGGLYLCYLGIKLLMGAYDAFRAHNLAAINDGPTLIDKIAVDKTMIDTITTDQVAVDQVAIDNLSASNTTLPKQNVFTRAMLLSLTNPKAILFFLAFFVQFVDPNYPHPLLSFLVLAIILQIISLSYLNVMVLAGQRLATRFRRYPWLVVSSMGLVGLLFIGFALSLWLAQLG